MKKSEFSLVFSLLVSMFGMISAMGIEMGIKSIFFHLNAIIGAIILVAYLVRILWKI